MASPATGLRYNIRLMEMGLSLSINMSYIPDVGTPEALADVLIRELNKRNIVFGLDEDAILRIMRERILNEEVEIGRGTPPRPGHDASIELLLVPPSFTASAGEDGRVDYHEVENISPVKAGDIISRKRPQDPGVPGINVFGKPVRPQPVRDARHPAGKNTHISVDGLEMSAAIDGFLRWNQEKIDVLDLYVVKGDVDLHTGNIRYAKGVEIFGTVTTGFEVVAGGDVRIYGRVEGGKVVSQEGTVTVQGSVMGSDKAPAIVSARGDVQIGRARFANIESTTGQVLANFAVEHSEIRAAGDLVLRAGPAMNCVINVGGKVDISNVSSRQPLGVERGHPHAGPPSHGNRRQYLRVMLPPPPPPVQVSGRRSSDQYRGDILDLSAGGMRLRLRERLDEGDRHRLQFTLAGVPGTMWMDAEVVRTVELAKAPPPSPQGAAPAAAEPGTVPPANGEPAAPQPSEPKPIPSGQGNSYGLKFVQIEPAVRESLARFCLAEDLRQHKQARTA